MAFQVTGCLPLLISLLLLQPQLGAGPEDSAIQSSPRGFSGKSPTTTPTEPEKPESLPKGGEPVRAPEGARDKPNKKATELPEADVNRGESGSCWKIPKKELKMVNNRDRKGGLCASAQGKDSCQGDSWGPLFCDINKRWVQVAVVSWGIGCGHRTPGVYTDVTFYQRWIVREVSRSTRLDPEGRLLPCLCLLLLLASWWPSSPLPSPF